VKTDRTREQVARLLLAEGPATAAALSDRLNVSPAAVRRHLDAMIADGTLVAREERQPTRTRRRRGRPARVFALSERGHARAPHAYDDLALSALSLLDEVGAVEAFASRRAGSLAQRYGAATDVDSLAEALSADGYAATVHEVASGVQLCQHHCPVSEVAQRFPQLCDAETEAIGRLLGTHVQRLATIAHGDGVCTTHIPNSLATTVPPEGRHS
jgi:predicted ArsR family transcriptional regulator